MTILIITGTDTDVGKTVVTAAIAACATGRVAVVKPAQTGMLPGAHGDLAEITRLSGCTDVHEFARYPDAMSPHHAAYASGLPVLDQAMVEMRILALEHDHDLVLVEGAGGAMVPYDERGGWTMLDLAMELDAGMLVVTRAGLGTINHTALTLRAIEESGVTLAGIAIGRWPVPLSLVERHNINDLALMAPQWELAGVLPERMSSMRDFSKHARAALTPRWGGTLDWPAFRAAVRP